MLSFFRRGRRGEPFVASPMRDNWYQAKERGVTMVDADFVERINRERNG